MILDSKDIKKCKSLINGIRVKAFLHNDIDVINFTNMMLEMVDFYESHMNSWEYTTHHDRQSTSFLKRFACALYSDNIINPEYFEGEFYYLLNDYPAIKQRFEEWLRGDNK